MALSRNHCGRMTSGKREIDSACGQEGRCTPKSGACVAAGEADCKLSKGCKEDGKCVAQGGKCVATKAGCKKLPMCLVSGRCSMVDGRCAPKDDNDCDRAGNCRQGVLCKLGENGKYMAKSNADSRIAVIRVMSKRSRAKDGICVK